MIEVMLDGQVLGISALCIWGLLLLGYHTVYNILNINVRPGAQGYCFLQFSFSLSPDPDSQTSLIYAKLYVISFVVL